MMILNDFLVVSFTKTKYGYDIAPFLMKPRLVPFNFQLLVLEALAKDFWQFTFLKCHT